ncbi:tRNA (guanosine(46)-N7)-methyltransferase TrmB [Adhaeribacter soli]|uniref:tRNA (guanine-N(7)-)-methyltransferase n=1 Tax=Adhaeribacter soli TaxID=2607655 RepID=A0A5N1IHU2_9BACT|nr:tRNA (guanosine(46)-N7)-methyltransferase TrmB [Adhaeribacter soli]KAA9325235.1 tRNA (guanosine(46)-N7)-methyltransferase TrmB [Adhaeribacter soli]
MGRSKLEKFKVIGERRNVVEPRKENFKQLKGLWSEDFFGNNHELILEIGCGKGDYTVGLANLFPNKNFIGVDIKGARLWKGSSLAEENGLTNVGFLRTFIEEITEHFAENEVSELWVTFPDPRPRLGEEKKRLTSPRFMNMYKQLVKPGGTIHFKTDNLELFDYTLELLQKAGEKNLIFTHDLYASDLQHHTLGIQTTYERKFLGEGIPIKYLQFEV